VDYTGTVVAPVVLQGLSYPLTVTGNTAGNYTTHFTAFFDWDQDGTFEDVQPMGSINNDACNTEVTLAVTIPAISTGPTLMRIIKNYNASPTDPCGSYGWGQAEDYLIEVVEASCAPPVATASVTNVDCVTGTYTVSVDVTGLGDAADVDILSSANGGTISGGDNVGTGTYTTPPIPLGTPTDIVVTHNGDATCNLALGSFNHAADLCPVMVACGTPLSQSHCYGNYDATTWKWASSSG